ncbi:hypothetical protein [Cupriavidus basilensis]|uniref:hypothetical protein n=1 Tax=Cupriavidus basilensis TaxID=68895 RepID=UPI0014793B80|nr:hypothetical protein [Cupriavidus basilensis]
MRLSLGGLAMPIPVPCRAGNRAGRADRSDFGLAALAADAGYADQAHLSREIQSLCGMTASALLRQLHAPKA